jgi:Tfp pilus assembly protein PilW
MKIYSSIPGKSAQTGFSLVEAMVGIVISLLATVIIFQVFEVSEKIKRSSTGGGDAQQNGAAGLFYLERALREAGYGLNAGDANPVPLLITSTTSSVPDTITIASRKNWGYGPFVPDQLVFPSAVPPALTLETFSVAAVNGQSVLQSDVNGVLADGIVQLKVQYGYDNNGDGIVDSSEWAAPPPTAAVPMNVKAARLVLVARSSQGDKPPCSTTTVQPTWIGGSVDLSLAQGLSGTDDWKCYRYKMFEITVPLRNVIWKP